MRWRENIKNANVGDQTENWTPKQCQEAAADERENERAGR